MDLAAGKSRRNLENKSGKSESLGGRGVHDATLIDGAMPIDECQPTGATAMPLIEVHLIEKVFSPEQKHQIIEKLTDAMVSIEGENMRGVTWVKIEEVTSGDWGIGGQPLTTEAVKALAAGRSAA
jgi:4-oxalocrotonate tautomerase